MQYLKKLLHKLVRISGYDFIRYTPENFASLRRSKIINSQGIDLVLDIGADEGAYPVALRQMGYQGHIISFEPLPKSFALLKKRADKDQYWDCENIAVGNFNGTTELNISRHKTSSSILPMNTPHLRAMPSSNYIGKMYVAIKRLDSILKTIDWAQNLYLKIDVQGYEKHVLQGATETLKRTKVMEVELSLVPLYRGAMLLPEAIDYIGRNGFRLLSIEPVFIDPETGGLLQVDGFFSRNTAN